MNNSVNSKSPITTLPPSFPTVPQETLDQIHQIFDKVKNDPGLQPQRYDQFAGHQTLDQKLAMRLATGPI